MDLQTFIIHAFNVLALGLASWGLRMVFANHTKITTLEAETRFLKEEINRRFGERKDEVKEEQRHFDDKMNSLKESHAQSSHQLGKEMARLEGKMDTLHKRLDNHMLRMAPPQVES